MPRIAFFLVALGAAASLLACGCSSNRGMDRREFGDTPRVTDYCRLRYQNEARWNRQSGDLFLAVIHKYGGPGAGMIDDVRERLGRLCGRPSYEFVEFLPGDRGLEAAPATEEEMLGSVRTAVHETAHLYKTAAGIGVVYRVSTHVDVAGRTVVQLNGARDFLTLRLPGGRVLPVPKDPAGSFRASELSRTFGDQALRTGRYGLYIEQQAHSVDFYDLLDEFHAYYYGFLAQEIADVARTEHALQSRPGRTRATMIGISDYPLSFAEFKLFIVRYLVYAREKHPGQYRELMDNKPMLEAFLALHDAFEEALRPALERDRLAVEVAAARYSDRESYRAKYYTAVYDVFLTYLQRSENVAMLNEMRRAADKK